MKKKKKFNGKVKNVKKVKIVIVLIIILYSPIIYFIVSLLMVNQTIDYKDMQYFYLIQYNFLHRPGKSEIK